MRDGGRAVAAVTVRSGADMGTGRRGCSLDNIEALQLSPKMMGRRKTRKLWHYFLKLRVSECP